MENFLPILTLLLVVLTWTSSIAFAITMAERRFVNPVSWALLAVVIGFLSPLILSAFLQTPRQKALQRYRTEQEYQKYCEKDANE